MMRILFNQLTPLVVLSLTACQGPQTMMTPAGTEAEDVMMLWWILFGIGIFVILAVTFYLLRASYRGLINKKTVSDKNLTRGFNLALGITCFLLLIIMIATLKYSQPFKSQQIKTVAIEVIGKLWWWEVHYLDENGNRLFTTANEIHLPVNRPIRLRLLSDNVIHSFWVPALGGKVDLVPGRENHIWLEAKTPGIYRGQCAEFCGKQHALMAFNVIAQKEEEFLRWKMNQQKDAPAPIEPLARRGREVFQEAKCMRCHTIKGLTEVTHLGPDLTHLASRIGLAAATLPNTKGHLAGWIGDPQGIKPGNLMPATPLMGKDFQALLHYLQELK
jgi:cytochrome c oxidase subunit II